MPRPLSSGHGGPRLGRCDRHAARGGGCNRVLAAEPPPAGTRPGAETSTGASPAVPTARPSGPPTATAAPPARRVRPADLDAEVAVRTVQHLAATIGPRHATSPAYRRAARWVSGELASRGHDVRRQTFDVPGGISWGVPVAAGTSQNVIATPPGFDAEKPHLVVGAHLDTVPQAPGAEDNASGVGIVLAIATAVQERATRLPVVLVAFGAEEPRGEGDAHHHYGSRAYVASLPPSERRAVRGMLSLDRVGVGTAVPVCSAIGADPVHREEALDAASRAGVAAQSCENSSSDHWSFVRRGHARGPHRRHVVRRLPLVGGRAVRRQPPAARTRGTAGPGLAGGAEVRVSGTDRSCSPRRRGGCPRPGRPRHDGVRRSSPSGRASARRPSAGRPRTSRSA